jgi:voltage-gated potassium channel
MKKEIAHERNKLLHSIEKLLDGPMIFLGFVWLVLLIVELIWGLTKVLEYLSITVWIAFIIDFIIKFILAPLKLAFLKKNWLTAISLVIPALRIFRVFRIIRLLRGLRGIRLSESFHQQTVARKALLLQCSAEALAMLPS